MQPEKERPASGGAGTALSTIYSRAADQGTVTRPARRGPVHPRLKVLFEVNGRMREVEGQCARALLALVSAGADGVTAIDVGGWAYRLAAYTHTLRKRHGLVVTTEREAHPGGWHGRHVLCTPVRIHSIDG